MGKNKGEITELLAAFDLILDGKKVVIFGNRLKLEYKNDFIYKCFDLKKNIKIKEVNITDIKKLRDELIKEMLVAKNINGSYKYKTLEKITNLLNVKENQLSAPSLYPVDITADSENYTVKSQLGSCPSAYNYSKMTAHLYETTLKPNEINKYLKFKDENSFTKMLSLLYIEGKIVENSFLYDDAWYCEFLEKIDKNLPNILAKISFLNVIKKSSHIEDILTKKEMKSFNKFAKFICNGLTLRNMKTFLPQKMKEIYYDKNLNRTIKDTNSDEYIKEFISSLRIDRGASKRTGIGQFEIIDEKVYLRDDLYLRINKSA